MRCGLNILHHVIPVSYCMDSRTPCCSVYHVQGAVSVDGPRQSHHRIHI